MGTLGFKQFLKTLPACVRPHLPPDLQQLQTRQPFGLIIQFYDGDVRIHYEVQRVPYRKELELGLHFESLDKGLNQRLLQGFAHQLVAIKAELGSGIEAEIWDRGWTKLYELYPEGDLTTAYQQAVGQRLATMIAYLHPILLELHPRMKQ